MLKNVANLGQILSKNQQRFINGGMGPCFIYSWSDLLDCQERGGEIAYCAPHVECEVWP